jgi:MerR family mercuric resistance operon transcriptional regulator
MRRAITKTRGEEFAIGALAAETGVKIETIRYYERIALLPEPPRTQSRRRTYSREDILRLSFIKRARELGFAIDDIRTLLGLAEGSRDCAATRGISLRRLEEVRGKISSLRRFERALTRMTDACHPDHQVSCPIIEALGGASADITSIARR